MVGSIIEGDALFCGKRAPWAMAYKQPLVVVKVSGSPHITQLYGFFFALMYEATDVQSQLFYKTYNFYMFGTDLVAFFLSGNHYKKHHHNLHAYYVMAAFVHQVICITFSHNMDIKLHDGPGPLSKEVNIAKEEISKFCYSKPQGYVEIFHHNMSLNSSSIKWEMKVGSVSLGSCHMESAGYPHNGALHFKAHDAGSCVHCIWMIGHRPEEIQIHDISFQGYNMHSFLSFLSPIANVGIFDLCQYGGLHVLFEEAITNRVFKVLSFGSSFYNKPKIRLPHEDVTKIYLLFTTFDKYSTGHVDVSIRHSECGLCNFAFFDCLISPSFDFTNAQNIIPNLYHSTPEKIPHCKIIWIINNLNEQSMIESSCTLTYTFDDLNKVLLIGTHKNHYLQLGNPTSTTHG